MDGAEPGRPIGYDATNRAERPCSAHVPAMTIVFDRQSRRRARRSTQTLDLLRSEPEPQGRSPSHRPGAGRPRRLRRRLRLVGRHRGRRRPARRRHDRRRPRRSIPTTRRPRKRLFTTLKSLAALGGGRRGHDPRRGPQRARRSRSLDFTLGAIGMPARSRSRPATSPSSPGPPTTTSSSSATAASSSSRPRRRPGTSLADDARFKALAGRVGAENLGSAFVDIAAIRALVEPLRQERRRRCPQGVRDATSSRSSSRSMRSSPRTSVGGDLDQSTASSR